VFLPVSTAYKCDLRDLHAAQDRPKMQQEQRHWYRYKESGYLRAWGRTVTSERRLRMTSNVMRPREPLPSFRPNWEPEPPGHLCFGFQLTRECVSGHALGRRADRPSTSCADRGTRAIVEAPFIPACSGRFSPPLPAVVSKSSMRRGALTDRTQTEPMRASVAQSVLPSRALTRIISLPRGRRYGPGAPRQPTPRESPRGR
jgi:hypothetical protein